MNHLSTWVSIGYASWQYRFLTEELTSESMVRCVSCTGEGASDISGVGVDREYYSIV